jgi:hypothetical protein
MLQNARSEFVLLFKTKQGHWCPDPGIKLTQVEKEGKLKRKTRFPKK